MATKLAALKRRAKAAGIPSIYVNDNFGRWQSDFQHVLRHCLDEDVCGRPLARLLQPDAEDYFVLKPKHSGFYATTLELVLQALGARTLILTGIAGNICVLFTANDAYMRGYRLVIPADCVALQTVRENTSALHLMQTVLNADIRPSTALDLPRMLASPQSPCRGTVEDRLSRRAVHPVDPAQRDDWPWLEGLFVHELFAVHGRSRWNMIPHRSGPEHTPERHRDSVLPIPFPFRSINRGGRITDLSIGLEGKHRFSGTSGNQRHGDHARFPSSPCGTHAWQQSNAGNGARCSASCFPSLLSHFDTRSIAERLRVVPCPSCTGDMPSSLLRRQNVLFEILHLVLQLVEVFRQFLLRQRKHLGFFFFHMMFDVLHELAELRVKVVVIWPHLPQRRNQVLDLLMFLEGFLHQLWSLVAVLVHGGVENLLFKLRMGFQFGTRFFGQLPFGARIRGRLHIPERGPAPGGDPLLTSQWHRQVVRGRYDGLASDTLLVRLGKRRVPHNGLRSLPLLQALCHARSRALALVSSPGWPWPHVSLSGWTDGRVAPGAGSGT